MVNQEDDATTMPQAGAQIGADGGRRYTINAKDETMQSVKDKPSSTNAYACFGEKENVGFGQIKAVGSEMLVMQKNVSDTELSFAVCNPNLRPQSATKGWEATATHTAITLSGEWKLASATSDDVIVAAQDGNTTITLVFIDGIPIHFDP